MPFENAICPVHPEGETHSTSEISPKRWPLTTPGGRVFAEWQDDLPVTREGQLIFFFQFLHEGRRWSELLADTPLGYQGNQGSGALKVFGTLLLSVLCGHHRYAHINSVRGDGVNPQLLGMDKVVSEDTVRRVLKRIEPTAGLAWLEKHLIGSISPALVLPWILDIDTTVKRLVNVFNRHGKRHSQRTGCVGRVYTVHWESVEGGVNPPTQRHIVLHRQAAALGQIPRC